MNVPVQAIVGVARFLFLFAWSLAALAHSRGETWSTLQITGQDIAVTYSLPATDLARYLPGIARSGTMAKRLEDAVISGYQMTVDGIECEVAQAEVSQNAEQIDIRWLAQCPPGVGLKLTNDALFDQLPNHLHIAQAVMPGGEIREHLFTMAERRWDLTARAGLVDTLSGYFELGVFHIVTGYDHLAFLFAVILLTPRMMTLLLMVTGFTVGHSLTLALAVLGYARVDSGAVEALIGFTIALVAAEVVATRHRLQLPLVLVTTAALLTLAFVGNAGAMPAGPSTQTLLGLCLFCLCYLLLSTKEDLRDLIHPILTLLFGLIHGFGFAGLLAEIGLPQEYLLTALIGFNLGVEAGQLVVLGCVVAGGLLLVRRTHLPAYTVEAVAACLCGLGLFLFVSRSFAG